MSWSDLLKFITQPNGIVVVVGALLSVLAEYIPQYQPLSEKWKRLVFAAACLVVPLVGALLGVLTGVLPPGWTETWWPAILAGASAFAGGTLLHTRSLK